MQELKELLDATLCNTTFAGPRAENISSAQLRELLNRKGWPNDEVINAQNSRPNISGESICLLTDHVRYILNDYVDPLEDTIGYAFPAGVSPFPPGNNVGSTVFGNSGLTSKAWVSPVETLARGLVKGSAAIGTERVTQLILDWLQGEPVEYKTMALLNALPVKEPLEIEGGVCVDILPLSTDKLPANLPTPLGGMSAEEFLGRTILVVSTTASPVFIRPKNRRLQTRVTAASSLEVSTFTLCHAISLTLNSYLDLVFFWHDFQELEAFSFTANGISGNPSGTRVKKRPYSFAVSTSRSTGVKEIEPQGEIPTLEFQPTQLSTICKGLRGDYSKKTQLALTRWIASKDFEKNRKDQFIDLRIALESLYLQDFLKEQSQEMRFRLPLFGAWHLGSDFEERKKIRRTLRDAYDTASAAVHGGDLADTLENRELLSNAQDLCRRGILKILEEGYPSQELWGDLILGVEANDD